MGGRQWYIDSMDLTDMINVAPATPDTVRVGGGEIG